MASFFIPLPAPSLHLGGVVAPSRAWDRAAGQTGLLRREEPRRSQATEGLRGAEAALRLIMGRNQPFAGRPSDAAPWLEQAAADLEHPGGSAHERLVRRMVLFNHLYHVGDFANYFDQKQRLEAAMGREAFRRSLAGHCCLLWELDIALGQGRFGDAASLAEESLAWKPSPGPAMRGLASLFLAAALALAGKRDQALAVAAAPARPQERGAGVHSRALGKLLRGLTLGLCRKRREGLALLGGCIADAREIPCERLEAGGLMHRGALHLACGNQAAAREDVASGLALLRRNGMGAFWACAPGMAAELLGFAASGRQVVDLVRDMADKRLDADLCGEGALVPRVEFKLFGGFSLRLRGVSLPGSEDMTPVQREFLCLLVVSPGRKLFQESVLLHFWPDSTPEAGKATLDTLVSRLRKTMARMLPERCADRCLRREKGVLWLDHCRVDALDYLALAESGLEHFRARRYWQAGNLFARADALWQGDFAPGVSGGVRLLGFRRVLARRQADMALAWCPLLLRSNRREQAVACAGKALRADPLNEALWGLLYRLRAVESSVLAREVLERFAALLRNEQFAEQDIRTLVRTVEARRDDLPGGELRAWAE